MCSADSLCQRDFFFLMELSCAKKWLFFNAVLPTCGCKVESVKVTQVSLFCVYMWVCVGVCVCEGYSLALQSVFCSHWKSPAKFDICYLNKLKLLPHTMSKHITLPVKTDHTHSKDVRSIQSIVLWNVLNHCNTDRSHFTWCPTHTNVELPQYIPDNNIFYVHVCVFKNKKQS